MTESLLKKRKKKGFTLIELIVVIAIIAIIALVAIPKVMGYQDSAKEKTDIANAKTIATTTATLLADGKLTGGNEDLTIGNTTSAPADQLAIEAALQSIPKPQAKNTAGAVPSNFVVHISSGTITVDNGTTGDQLYPKQLGVYAN